MNQIQSLYLIDDDTVFHYLTNKIIRETKKVVSIVSFYNGAEAIEMLTLAQNSNARLPDVILLDLSMPIMDGWEFLEEFSHKIKPKNQPIIIYIVSSSISPTDIQRVNHYKSVKDFIIKPITREKFNYIIDGILN